MGSTTTPILECAHCGRPGPPGAFLVASSTRYPGTTMLLCRPSVSAPCLRATETRGLWTIALLDREDADRLDASRIEGRL